MAFEPIKTDEPYTGPKTKPDDMDAQMLVGCTGFVIVSVGGYLLSIWPFFAFQDTEKLSRLLQDLAIGLGPATLLGIIGIRKYGISGACGFVGGAVTTGIFLYLRIQQSMLAGMARQAPTPDYPPAFSWLIPLAYFLAAIGLSVALLPKDKPVSG